MATMMNNNENNHHKSKENIISRNVSMKKKPLLKNRRILRTTTNLQMYSRIDLIETINGVRRMEKKNFNKIPFQPLFNNKRLTIISKETKILTNNQCHADDKKNEKVITKDVINQKELSFSSTLLPLEVENIDKKDGNNCLLVSEYVNDVYAHLRKMEKKFSLNAHFIANPSEIRERKRALLIDWIISTHNEFNLLQETLFMTVFIIDQYLSKEPISKEEIQLLGITSLFIASKYEEIYPPCLTDFVRVCDFIYRKKEIIRMEIKILKTLNFDLSAPLPIHFLRRFSKANRSSPRLHTLSKFLMELTLTEYECAHWKPSLLAAAALYTSTLIEGNVCWSLTHYYYTQYCEHHIRNYSAKMCKLILDSVKSPFQACRRKYSSKKFYEVSCETKLTSKAIRDLAMHAS